MELESTGVESYDHIVLSMRLSDRPTGKVPSAKPSPNHMRISERDVQDLQKVLWAKAEGIACQARLNLLKRTWKSSIRSKEDEEEYTLPNLEVPLVYSLNYTHQSHEGWGDEELPPESVPRMRKQELGRSSLHAEEDLSEKLESPNLDLCLTSVIKKYQEVFGALPPLAYCKKLVQADLKLKPQFEGLVVRHHPYPAPQDQIDEIEAGSKSVLMLASSRSINMGTDLVIVVRVFSSLSLDPLLCAWPLTMVRSIRRPKTTHVPFVNRPFESEIHGTVNFTQFCCVLLVTWCYRVLLSCYLRPK